jgi:hypothetical protein
MKVVLIQILILALVNCQNTTTITAASLEYDGVFGIGWGVFAIILGIVFGMLCCLFGISTLYPK